MSIYTLNINSHGYLASPDGGAFDHVFCSHPGEFDDGFRPHIGEFDQNFFEKSNSRRFVRRAAGRDDRSWN